jgi:predicted transcriptional regulator of viral defense system
MQFIELKQNLNNFIVFSINDIKKIWPDFHRRRLNNWQDKNYIKKVTRGYYVFSDKEVNENVLYIIANEIFNPSYVSLESALSYYNLIPEGVYSVISVSSKKTILLKTFLGDFNYRKIKTELMFGYQLVNYQGHNFKMAEIEKAVLDYFYINSKMKTDDDFFEMRFNVQIFKEMVNMDKFDRYLKAFNNKSLERRIKKFLKFINNADNRTN